jgi:aryl-alcohol dehydrogenase-like predicted oxidoreductase
MFPRAGPAHRAANAALAGVVREVAHELEATMAQVALAWLLARDARVVPIPGSRRAERIEENAGASGLALPPAALAKLDGLAARVSGPRYGPDRPQPGWVSPPLTAT